MTTSDDRDKHDDATDRLWRAIRRDLGSTILFMGGFTKDEAPMRRLERNWAKLCDHDLDVAGHLYHGVSEVSLMMARHDQPNSPAEHYGRQIDELLGLATIARERHPDANVKTLGELIDLGEESIRAEIDAETDETG